MTDPDSHLQEKIREKLSLYRFGNPLYYFERIGSTNSFASEAARAGGREGTLVIAERQTEGRGRRGRKWFSPSGSSLSFSFILRPGLPPRRESTLSLLPALAAAGAIESLTGLKAGIKWPNDIIINRRKAGGILIEGARDNNGDRFLIVGIGLNVNTTAFPPDLKDTATSLLLERGEATDRADLLAALILKLERLYYTFLDKKDYSDILTEYRKRSVTMGERVRILGNGGERTARAVEITDRGELIVEDENGAREIIRSGEVSLRSAEN